MSPRSLPAILAIACAAACSVPSAPARAQEPAPAPVAADSAATAAPRALRFCGSCRDLELFVPRITQGPRIDGSLDDDAWRQAAVLDSFVHGRPVEGVPDSLGTECYVMYDDANLYVGFRVHDDPRLVDGPIVPRDAIWQGDWVGMSIDSYNDRQRSVFLCANPAGIQMDGVDVEGADSDMAPDFLYTSESRLTEGGWECEFSIPFKTLRFANRDTVTFGFNAIRDVQRDGAHLYWAPISRDRGPYHGQIGTLRGLADVKPGRNLQLNPTVTAARQGLRESGTLRYEDDSRIGLGVKYGLTSNLIADLAITPDFSQVESDAGVVNINERFAIFFPERRPFFLEGRDIFATELDLVYTRSIVDPVYGLKLTGKQGRTGVGLIHAQDQSASGSVETLPDAKNPYYDENARFDIVRLRQDVFRNSFVGVMFADRQHGDAYNRLAYADGRFSFQDRWTVQVEGAGSDSREQDMRGAIASLTPEEDAALDPALRDLQGARLQGGTGVVIVNRSSRRVGLTGGFGTMSRDFRADMGSLERTGFHVYVLEATEHFWAKGKTWWTNVDVWQEWERNDSEGEERYFGGRKIDEEYSAGGELRLASNAWVGAGYERIFTFHEGVEFPGQDRWDFWVGSERHRLLRGGIEGSIGETVIFEEVVPGHDRSFSLWSDWRFSKQFDASFTLSSSVVERADGTRYADIVIPRIRLGYQVTKELALRWITELRSSRDYDVTGAMSGRDKEIVLDALATYYVRPGTVVYLGYGSLRDGGTWEDMTVSNNNLFLKLSYLWQM